MCKSKERFPIEHAYNGIVKPILLEYHINISKNQREYVAKSMTITSNSLRIAVTLSATFTDGLWLSVLLLSNTVI